MLKWNFEDGLVGGTVVNDVGNKSSRVLYIYEELINGHIVTADDVATRFNVCNRVVHRDIEEVKGFCVNGICWNQSYKSVIYDREKKGYMLTL